ncbi:hypothetical protein EV356DRAFT_63094 [Viridothelium virens]|uniref:Uncharacterized protein n=1 Tax=Viridothelium virens TaxID=1048519 RepID=A0A6A6HGL7_VIRVR|nr:hypothetical protein EV356DRAFT_63094 [Viridothelium virens]
MMIFQGLNGRRGESDVLKQHWHRNPLQVGGSWVLLERKSWQLGKKAFMYAKRAVSHSAPANRPPTSDCQVLPGLPGTRSSDETPLPLSSSCRPVFLLTQRLTHRRYRPAFLLSGPDQAPPSKTLSKAESKCSPILVQLLLSCSLCPPGSHTWIASFRRDGFRTWRWPWQDVHFLCQFPNSTPPQKT